MRPTVPNRLASCALVAIACTAASSTSRAQERTQQFELAAGTHVLSIIGSCAGYIGNSTCGLGRPFVGLDVSGHAPVTTWFSPGVRVAGSLGLGPLIAAAPDSMSSAPVDVREARLLGSWLLRVSAEARFDPPVWPRGLWIALELGTAFAFDRFSASQLGRVKVSSGTFTQPGGFGGFALGWDFVPSSAWRIGLEVRSHLLIFGRQPVVPIGVIPEDVRTDLCATLAARVGHVF